MQRCELGRAAGTPLAIRDPPVLRAIPFSGWVESWPRIQGGLVVRDAWRCHASHHEGRSPHPEERAWARLEGWSRGAGMV